MKPHMLYFVAAALAPLQATTAQTADANADKLDHAFVQWQLGQLKDPDSAKWQRTKEPFHTTVTLKRGLLGKKEWTGELACYLLNGRNSYGAYTGYTPQAVMITDQGAVMVWSGMSPSEGNELYRSYGQQIIDNYCS